MIHDISNPPGFIELGNQGEKGANAVQFDLTAWVALYPVGAGQVAEIPGAGDGLWLTYTRAGETAVYPEEVASLSVALDDDVPVLTWIPSPSVMYFAGQGTVVIHCSEGSDEKRSVMTSTIVIAGHVAAGEAPEPLADYIAKWGTADATVETYATTPSVEVTQDETGTHFLFKILPPTE